MLVIFAGCVAVTRLKEEKLRFVEVLDRPEIEQFIPLKSNSEENPQFTIEKESCDKKNWMNSAQLWSTETRLVNFKAFLQISIPTCFFNKNIVIWG